MGAFPHSIMLNDIRDIMTFDIRDPPRKKTKILGKTFVNRNGNVVTLQQELKPSPILPKGGSRNVLSYPLVPSWGKGVRRTGKGSLLSPL